MLSPSMSGESVEEELQRLRSENEELKGHVKALIQSNGEKDLELDELESNLESALESIKTFHGQQKQVRWSLGRESVSFRSLLVLTLAYRCWLRDLNSRLHSSSTSLSPFAKSTTAPRRTSQRCSGSLSLEKQKSFRASHRFPTVSRRVTIAFESLNSSASLARASLLSSMLAHLHRGDIRS